MDVKKKKKKVIPHIVPISLWFYRDLVWALNYLFLTQDANRFWENLNLRIMTVIHMCLE